ncbi:MAG TPA: hypothetical protein PK635_16440 [Actinomycetota bacterium]|nr:hypothetical protein [Actinomycetota bacterium]
MRDIGRWLLAGFLAVAGIGHFAAADTFRAQVPPWMPYPEAVIAVSGVIELGFAAALVLARERRALVGWLLAGFFIVIFPGNISQFVTGTDAFGLDSDFARGVRLLFQPVLVVWALWCTSAWRQWRRPTSTRSGVVTPEHLTRAIPD